MTTYSFVDESGETRLRGTIDPAPGGALPVQWTVDADGSLNILDAFGVTRARLAADGRLNLYRSDATIAMQAKGDFGLVRVFDGTENATNRMDETGFYGPGVVTAVSIPLTSAEILACHTTPIDLVASPGSGQALVVSSAFVQIIGQTVGYTLAGNIGIFSDTTVQWGSFNVPFAFAGDQVAGATDGLGPYDAVAMDGFPLVFRESAADPTNGDGDAIVSFLYRVIDIG